MWDFDSIINKALIIYGEDSLFEIIVKYSGDILEVGENENVFVEVLNSSFAIITLTYGQIRNVLQYKQIDYIEIPQKLSALQQTYSFLTNYYQESYVCPTNLNLTGKGVIVAILDSGITYQHDDFKNSDGTTRIKYIWDQTVNGNPPDGFFEGTVYTKEMIDNALKTNIPLNTNDRTGHGTMVAGISVGNGNTSNGEFKGVAPEADIIAVKLGKKEYESFAMTTEFMRGIKFCYDKAILEDKPLVINISYGTNSGSHNGDTLFEEYINDMISSYPSNIVIATGNEGDAGHHFDTTLMTNELENVQFTVVGGLNSFYFSMWKNFVDEISIELISPNNESTGIITFGESLIKFNFSGVTVSIVYTPPTPYRVVQEIYFQFDYDTYTTETSTWTLNIYGVDIVGGNCQIWLPTIEEVTKESHFLNPTTSTTLTVPSTANGVITVGGYNTSTNKIAPFSGKGLTSSDQQKPDIVAPGVEVLTTDNILGYDVVDGTSFSAPFVTGACAVLMQYGIVEKNEIFLYGEKMKAYLLRGANRLPDIVYPNRDFGYGSLCIQGAIDLINTINSINTVAKSNTVELLVKKDINTLNELSNLPFLNTNNIDMNTFNDFIILDIPESEYTNTLNTLSKTLVVEEAIPLTTMSESFSSEPFNFNSNFTGENVLIGVIDTDINIFDDSLVFDNENTKIKYYLDMTTEYCKEYNERELNSILKDNIKKTIKESHGNLITSTVSNIASQSNYIIVELNELNDNIKSSNLITNKKVYSSIDVIKAVYYITNRAKELDMPVVIGICLGSNKGHHNGNSIFEKYLSKVSLEDNVCICISSGNEGNKKHHVDRILSNKKEETLTLNVCKKQDKLPVYLYTNNVKSFSLQIITPNNESHIFESNSIYETYNYNFKLEKTKFEICSNLKAQEIIIKFENCESGIYKIKFTPNIESNSKLHAYLPTSTLISNNTFFLSNSSSYTVTVPATADDIITVGAFNIENTVSGRGPSVNMNVKPTFVVESEKDSSYATAVAIGACALIFEQQRSIDKNTIINTEVIKNILINNAVQNEKYFYPNNIEGYGLLHYNF